MSFRKFRWLCGLLALVLLLGVACTKKEGGNAEEFTSAEDAATEALPKPPPANPQLPGTDIKPTVTYSFDQLITSLSPIAAWNGEVEEDGKTVKDSVGLAHGTLVDCDSVTGRTGKAVQTYPDAPSYIELGKGTLGRLIDGKSAMTVSMWVMPYVHHGDTYRLLTMQVSNKLAGMHVYYKNGSIIVGGRSCSADAYTAKDFSYNLSDGTLKSFQDYTNEGRWQHLVMALDFANNNIYLYVNGVKLFAISTVDFKQTSFTLGTPADTDAFGGAATAGVLGFNGLMDEMMLFDRTLSAEEVMMLYCEAGEDNSPAADEKMIKSIVEKMSDGFAVCGGNNRVLQNGRIDRVEPTDYSVVTWQEGDGLYLPESAAQRYFAKVTAGKRTVDGKSYYDIAALCAENGKTCLRYGSMAVVTSSAAFDATADVCLLERMLRFFETPMSELACEQSRTVVARTGDMGTVRYCQSPSIAVRGSEIWQTMDSHGKTYVYKSTDGGASFTNTAVISNFNGATAFVHQNMLYLLGRATYGSTVAVGICNSSDGVTWSEMDLTQGIFGAGEYDVHAAPTPVLFANGRIYKACGRAAATWKEKCQAFMISADASANLLDPASWTVSDPLTFTPTMFSGHKNGSTIPNFAYIEEGNAVQGKDGCVYGIYRVNSQPDPGFIVRLKLSEDGKTLSFEAKSETSVLPFNGGVTKFCIRYDESTGYYMALLNNITRREAIWQRNVLSLAVSEDLVNWRIADTVLTDRTMMNEYVSITAHGFQYVDFVIDGEDILMAVRESMGDAENFHNANHLTFYRLKNYKQVIDHETN